MAEYAWRQAGAFSLLQVIAAGGSRTLADRRVSAGVWLLRGPSTFALAGAPYNWRQRLWIAHLDLGPASLVGYEAAACLLRAPLFDVRTVSLIVPHASTHRTVDPAVRVRQTRHPWPAQWITRVDGLPVTDLAATYVDLAADRSNSAERIAESADQAITAGRLTTAQLSTRLRHVARGGRKGVVRMEKVIDRLRGTEVLGSVLESRFQALVRAAGDPALVPQYPVPWRSDRQATTDFADPDVTAYFELDGRTWHDRRTQQLQDRQRDQAASRAGWLPTRFLAEQLDDEPDVVLETVRAIRRQRAGMVWRPRSA